MSSTSAPQTSTATVDKIDPSVEFVERLLESDNDEAYDDAFDNDGYGSSNLYTWEKGADRVWEQCLEIDGKLTQTGTNSADISQKNNFNFSADNRKFRSVDTRICCLRNVVMMIDTSLVMKSTDIRPDRLSVAIEAAERYIKILFHVNPMSQIAVLLLQKNKATLVAPLSANHEQHLQTLRSVQSKILCEGGISIQIGLQRAIDILSSCPKYSARDVVLFFGSVQTIDPGDITKLIVEMKSENVRFSVITMAPEMYILNQLSEGTGGLCSVAVNANHFYKLVDIHVSLPTSANTTEPSLVQIGFPKLEKKVISALCACHNVMSSVTYVCPKCHSRTCSIPSKCKICNTYLLTSSLVYKSQINYIHVPESKQVPVDTAICHFCRSSVDCLINMCLACNAMHCDFCKAYISSNLGHCPNCSKEQLSVNYVPMSQSVL